MTETGSSTPSKKKQISFRCRKGIFDSTYQALQAGAKLVQSLEKLGIIVEDVGIHDDYDNTSILASDMVEETPSLTEEVLIAEEPVDKPKPKAKPKAKPKPKKETKAKAKPEAEAEAPAPKAPAIEPAAANTENADQQAWIKQLDSSIEAGSCSGNDVSVCLRLHAAVHSLEITKAKLASGGYERPSDVPDDKAEALVKAFMSDIIVPVGASPDDEDEF